MRSVYTHAEFYVFPTNVAYSVSVFVCDNYLSLCIYQKCPHLTMYLNISHTYFVRSINFVGVCVCV